MKQTKVNKPRFSRLERLKKSIGRKACLIALLLAVPLSQVPAQQVSNPAASPADAKYVDYGESIIADGQVFKLKRIANQVVVKARAGAARFDRDSALFQGGKTINRSRQVGDRIAIWADSTDAAKGPEGLQTLLDTINAEADVEYASPVYQVEGSDLLMCGTDELILEMRPDTDGEDLQRVLADYGLFYARPVVASDFAHVVRLAKPKEFGVLGVISVITQDPDVQTARHNFLQELRFSALPSDTYFGSHQWHLTPYAAGSPEQQNANIKADSAWSGSQPYGSAGIVVAVLDSGFQLNHPDLASNFLPGYDFFDGDADPSAEIDPNVSENHGTAVAGIIAAAVNNSGIVGGAPNCKILPVRIGNAGTFVAGDKLKAALVWAADRADVISCSWEYGVNTDVTAGFNYAATSGRKMLDGTAKGTLAFCASGNASRWKSADSDADIPIGTWKFRFRVLNNRLGGSDTTEVRASLGFVQFPDTSQTIWRFDEPYLPAGLVQETPGHPWVIVDAPGIAHGVGRYFMRSASFLAAGSGTSSFSTPPMQITSPGKLRFSYCVEYPSYDSYSKFYVERLQLVNNLWQPISTSVFESGVTVLLSPTTDFSVRYPATLSESIPTVVAVGASTDWDYRSDLSRYGGNALTFVAPGGSGYRDILTTDRTAGGYNMLPILNFADANYTWFKGTSAAAPLAASVAALVLSRNGHLTATSIKSILINACDKVHQADGKLAYDVSGRNEFVGYGRVNANSAVNAVTADIVAPQFSGAYVQTTRTIDLVFNEPMGGGIYTPLSFTISGAGKGTLANNPSQVIRLAPEKYRLVWNTGGMVAGTVTISTSGLKDVAGNALASPTSRDSTGTKAIELVNCGGSTVFPFGSGDPRTPWLAEDTGWVGNTRMLYTTSGYGNYTMNSVNTSEVTSPAPTGVYQTARAMYYNTGWATYTLKNVLPNETVKVRLHFNEFYGWSNAGDQIFHIRINNSNPGTYPDLPNYDIMNYTGVQMNKADIREFTITNGSGPMVIQLQPDQGWTGYYNWTLNGIEVMRP